MTSTAPAQTPPLILLAEDNPASAEVTEEILILLGYRVIVARDGIATVRMASEYLPDLILMDWHMPGLDGGLVLSLRGGDFELTVGQDFSIGYLEHDLETVRLYIEESFTFLVLTDQAAVPLMRG